MKQRLIWRSKRVLALMLIGSLLAAFFDIGLAMAQDDPDPVRALPAVVAPGDTFEVTVTFTSPADGFHAIGLGDVAPAGWTVGVDTEWCTPPASHAIPATPWTTDLAQYIWFGPYDEGVAFTAIYEVQVPTDAAYDTYTFPVGTLEYYIAGAGPYVQAIGGEHEVEVEDVIRPEYTLAIDSTEGGEVTDPGEGEFTYDEGTVVDLIVVADLGYEFVGWTGDIDEVDHPLSTHTFVTLWGDYEITANFSLIQYDLTIDSTEGGEVTDPGEGEFTYDCGGVVELLAVPDEHYRFVEWIGDIGEIDDPHAAETTITMLGSYDITAIFEPLARIQGQAWEVNCDILPRVTVTLYLDDDLIASTVSDEDGYYTLAVPGPGEYTVAAGKDGFKNQEQIIPIDELTTYSVDFAGDHGLVPNYPDMSYVLACVNSWQFGEPQCRLTMSKVLAVVNAWQFPPTHYDVTVLTHSGKGQVNTPPFEVGSSPWLLYFSADWSGHFAMSLRNGGYHGLVTNQPVSAGEIYKTYVYGHTGSLYFTIENAPADGQWTLEVIENPYPPVPSPGTVFKYSGKGQVNTPPFEVSSSPWRLEYMADWNGHFAVQVRNDGFELVINHAVSAGEFYETYVYGWTGSLHFHIQSAPSDGEWTLSVTEVL